MNQEKIIRVSGQADRLMFKNEHDKGRILLLDSSLVEIVPESIPRMGRSDQKKVIQNIMHAHIPDNPESYQMDYFIEDHDRNTDKALLIMIRKSILESIRDHYPWMPIYIDKLEETYAKYKMTSRYELFKPNRFSPVDKVVFSTILLFFSVLFLYFFTEQKLENLVWKIENNAVTLAREEALQLEARESELQILELKWNALSRMKPIKISRFLAAIQSETNSELTISRLSLNGRHFRIIGRSKEAVETAQMLRKSPYFSDSSLYQIIPDRNGNIDSFTIEGRYEAD